MFPFPPPADRANATKRPRLSINYTISTDETIDTTAQRKRRFLALDNRNKPLRLTKASKATAAPATPHSLPPFMQSVLAGTRVAVEQLSQSLANDGTDGNKDDSRSENTDEGFRTEDEAGFAPSDDESDSSSDYTFWRPAASNTVTYRDHLGYTLPRTRRIASESSIESYSSRNSLKMPERPLVERKERGPVNIRIPKPASSNIGHETAIGKRKRDSKDGHFQTRSSAKSVNIERGKAMSEPAFHIGQSVQMWGFINPPGSMMPRFTIRATRQSRAGTWKYQLDRDGQKYNDDSWFHEKEMFVDEGSK